jgi:hypothetical protein
MKEILNASSSDIRRGDRGYGFLKLILARGLVKAIE